ncbi:Uncharacterised protein [Listeria fleischmannii subsp. fleischmannii]|uniref:Uncharacterized protein n=1 Tax=Listeria fleischmannii subsp. fleischmannii TaxID=1671902 RepID=A0A2X3H9U4_9LIST|nr:hypothetical protein [Listeria fleischmannii]SQC69151.1 Uncharacterised protein [Listeria fleischmannii subsp. fleischmannii]
MKKAKKYLSEFINTRRCQKALNEHYALAIAALVDSGLKTDYLIGLADLIVKRDN